MASSVWIQLACSTVRKTSYIDVIFLKILSRDLNTIESSCLIKDVEQKSILQETEERNRR